MVNLCITDALIVFANNLFKKTNRKLLKFCFYLSKKVHSIMEIFVLSQSYNTPQRSMLVPIQIGQTDLQCLIISNDFIFIQ